MSETDENLLVIHKTVCDLAVVVATLAERSGHPDLADRVRGRLDAMLETWQLEIDLNGGARDEPT